METWGQALKEWNDKTQRPYRYAIPLKGSPENLLLREMMAGKKFRLRKIEPTKVYEEVNDEMILDTIRQAEQYVKKSK
jgi:hypothetical protein